MFLLSLRTHWRGGLHGVVHMVRIFRGFVLSTEWLLMSHSLSSLLTTRLSCLCVQVNFSSWQFNSIAAVECHCVCECVWVKRSVWGRKEKARGEVTVTVWIAATVLLVKSKSELCVLSVLCLLCSALWMCVHWNTRKRNVLAPVDAITLMVIKKEGESNGNSCFLSLSLSRPLFFSFSFFHSLLVLFSFS